MKKSVPRKISAKTDNYPGTAAACRPPPASAENPGLTAIFAATLKRWQRAHGRHHLPWQTSADPYRIWLSEIMLQQTQVSTVLPYYERFLAHFPDVVALGGAPVESVMAHWAGLGYYARARNLHRCAQIVAGDLGGRFPDTAARLAELPGIGRSTAAAIAVFAFGQRAAILDGNVKRVLCRVFAVSGYPGQASVERELWALAEQLLPRTGMGAYTQGLMDLGATVCTPKRPACERCPMAADCLARIAGRVDELPTPRPRKAMPTRSLGVLVLRRGKTVLLEQRPPAGIWGGLWSLPELREGETAVQGVDRLLGAVAECHAGALIHHSFTHFRLDIQPWTAAIGAPGHAVREPGGHDWAPLADLDRYGLPAPIRTLLSR